MRRPSAEQRKTLGAFLADRRGRLKPRDLGLPDGPRRTPGLRREEVAALAGVSVSWYTWLEPGRDLQASADALGRGGAVRAWGGGGWWCCGWGSQSTRWTGSTSRA